MADSRKPGDASKGPAQDLSELGAHHEDLPSLSVRRPILAIVMNLLVVIAGVAALLGVEVRELPNVDQPIVTVRVEFPGAAPETMDNEVTRELEGAAARVSGVTAISSASEEGNARMRIYFDPSVDINVAANDVREALAEVERRLPDNVENLTVIKANDESSPIIRISVSTNRLTKEQLTNLVEDRVVTSLLSVPGVAVVRLYGDRRRTLNVVIDSRRLASRQLSIDDVADALQSANLDVPAGSVESAEQNLLVRADASVIEEAKIERIVIRGDTRIGDVASVFYGPEEAVSYVRLNGEEVIGLGVIRQAQSNTIEISEGIEREEELRTLTNERNGQYATLIGILHRHFYGQPLPADELRPELLQGDVVFVLESDQRLEAVMPRDEWEPLLTTLVERDGLRIAAFTGPE